MARITTLDALRTLYRPPMERAVRKQLPSLDPHCRQFVELSPFLVISSTGADGRGDVSPRGERAGFVHILDDTTLAIPDRPGNNRLDTLSNIITDPAVGLMFMIPGVNEVLRVNGDAELRDDADLTSRFTVQERAPKLVILVRVTEAYLHCPKALMRSALWDPGTKVERAVLPSLSEMLRDQIAPGESFEAPEAALARYKTQLY
jgi:PPOX class probable FMN-dependent enzyme